MPQVESAYPVSAKREDRAIAGLSMGGSESLLTGLNNIDKFAYVGAFSSGGLPEGYAATFPALDAKSAKQLKTLWIACGTSDSLIEPNRKFKTWLKSQNIPFTDIETPGRAYLDGLARQPDRFHAASVHRKIAGPRRSYNEYYNVFLGHTEGYVPGSFCALHADAPRAGSHPPTLRQVLPVSKPN